MIQSLAVDVLVIWLSVIGGSFALGYHVPVLVFIAVIFFVSGWCWLVMDIWRIIKEVNDGKD